MGVRSVSARVVCLGLSVAGSGASAQVVSLGNLFTTNGLGQTTNINTLSGGPYNRVTFSTNWTHNSGTATSMGAAINFNAGSFYNLIASLSSISGYANNANPTTLNAVCNLSMTVSSATALSMIRAQNIQMLGFIAADWNNTTLTFSFQPKKPAPSGVVALGPFDGNTGSAFSIVTGGAGGFTPVAGLYSSEGYLLATNVGAAARPPTDQTGLLVGEPSGDPGLSNLDMPLGSYYLFIGGAGTTFTSDDFVGAVPPEAPGGLMVGTIGGTPFSDTFAQGQGRWYGFDIVPEPSSVALLVFAGLVSTRRRRCVVE